MTDDAEKKSLADEALDAANNKVDTAADQVDEIGQHFKKKLEAATSM